MITRALITKVASTEGVDARTIERDYVLTHVVALIARHDHRGCLVLKGGASLRLLHFGDYRYSADLDYSILEGTSDGALDLIRGALESANLDAITKLRLEDDRGTWWIYYDGPLRSGRSIKLDVSDDELVVNTEHVRLIERWPDISEVQVLAYTRVEVTAEKLRCLIQRFQCRDLLDLDLLLGDGVDLVDAAALFARKAAHKGIDPSSFEAAFEGKLGRYRKAWSTELLQYLPEVPHFDEVERRVRRALRRARLIA
jgi:predicted nucleotidyltransferase component of viral defense system